MNTLQLHDRNLTVTWSADDKDALMRSLGALRAAGLNVLSYTLQQESTSEAPGRYIMRAEFRVSRKFSAERLSALLDTLSGVHLESIVS
jgi:hypothetical protein